MKLRVRLAAVAIAAALMAAGAPSAAPRNPVYPRSTPDPTCWRAPDGTWRLSSTQQRILRSSDFFTWTDTGRRLFTREEERRIRSRWKNIWAPDVFKYRGEYLLYVTHINSAEDSAIYVYSSTSPDGPFTNGRMLTYGRDTGIIDTIDPEVVRDPASGRLWLYFGSTGKVHRVPLSSDGKSIPKGAKYEHVAGRHVHDNPDRMHVLEGTYLHWRKGWWYLFASRGRYFDWSYAIVVGRSKKLTGEFVDREGRPLKEGYGTVILSSEKGDEFSGPGHNGEIFTVRGHDYMPFHCHVEGPTPQARPLFVQEVLWDRDGWPHFVGSKPESDPRADVLRTSR